MSTYTNYTHGDLGDQTAGYDPDFDYPHLDDVRINELREVGVDKVVVQRQRPLHWSEETLPDVSFKPREYGDNDKSSPEQNWEEE